MQRVFRSGHGRLPKSNRGVHRLHVQKDALLRSSPRLPVDGKIKGIKIDGPKEKDYLSQRIFQVIRQRVKPSPSIQVDFVDLRGFDICTVFVPRGEDPLHFLDGVILVRYGSSDIKAQPEIVKRLLAAHAF